MAAEATATGDDGRTRTPSAAGEAGATVDTSALSVGQHLVVTGSGYDASRGIYVAICVIPADGVVTRNDHTALADRVQDLYIPVKFTA
ncbi:MAG: hypothetical protein JWP19_720 [Rhodoglobus sp.]|nr:hypothetical protein [Rhodoglobus sp.]